MAVGARGLACLFYIVTLKGLGVRVIIMGISNDHAAGTMIGGDEIATGIKELMTVGTGIELR